MALIDALYKEVDGLSLLSEALNFDFKTKGMDEAFTDEELEGMSGMQAMRDRVMRVIGRNPTVRDFLEVTRRGRPREAIVGGPKEIADRLEQWFTERACDGFVIAGTHMPGTFEDFVRFVVPELQRRGLFQKEYTGATLRENLGLPWPRARLVAGTDIGGTNVRDPTGSSAASTWRAATATICARASTPTRRRG